MKTKKNIIQAEPPQDVYIKGADNPLPVVIDLKKTMAPKIVLPPLSTGFICDLQDDGILNNSWSPQL